MKCFNCGNDADMEVFIMINGKMKKIGICMDCYREQTNDMLEQMKDENGEIDPEKIQKQMFEFFKNNKEEFDALLKEAIDVEDMEDLDMDEFDMSKMDFSKLGFNLNNQDLNEIFSNINKNVFNSKDNSYGLNNQYDDIEKYRSFDSRERQIQILQRSIQKKRDELFHHLQVEDYMSAASSRDEIREINRKIMGIKRLAKEGDN